uniref:RING-type E3 ubiquitin transferase n=1 Tax=Branchiostoma floridae TaxID=7739 RepID=C3ZB36_BRAFL|eukprot:XP_002594062.1 hypothetical protein BRAFLDRAFT_68498 [Branchiostoma floridae]
MADLASSLGEQIREELTCSICMELFTRPKVLPCQHTFCQDCLRDHAEVRAPFQCPNCRQEVKLPPQGVAGLPDNKMAANMCELRLQNQAILSRETREQSQFGNRCGFHPSEEVRLYCKQCNIPVCNECLDEVHSDHRTISLKKASQERKAPVQALIAEGRNILEVYSGFLKCLREKETSLDEQKQETDNSIIQAYDQEVQKVTENKDHLLFQVEETYKENKEAVQEKGTECWRMKPFDRVVGRFGGKAPLIIVQTEPAVFLPIDTPVPVLGHVMLPSLPNTISFGEGGSRNGQFDKPSGVAVSDEGEIFVTDLRNHRIQVFTLQGTFVRQFPTVVPSEEKMIPQDVAMDGEGNLWVVGRSRSAEFAVQYTKQGKVLRKFDLQYTGCERGVVVDTRRDHVLITQTLLEEGNVLVSDCESHRIYVYKEDGQFLFEFGGEGSGEGQLKFPYGICADRAGNIIVADWGNWRVGMFDKTGKFIKHIATGMVKPVGVAIGPQGQLVVTDWPTNAVHIIMSY